MVTLPTGDVRLGIKIEGIGIASAVGVATDARVRFVSGAAPSWDSSSLYRSLLPKDWSPGALEWSVDFLTGRSTLPDFSARIMMTDEALGWFGNLRPIPIGVPTLAMPSDSASGLYNRALIAGYTGQSGTMIHVGREAIKLVSESPSTDYVTVRGCFGTPIGNHDPDGSVPDVDIFDVPHVLDDRRVDLFMVDAEATGYDSELTFASGTIRDLGTIAEGGLHLLTFDVLGLYTLLGEVKLRGSNWTGETMRTRVFGDNNAVTVFQAVLPPAVETLVHHPRSIGASPSVGDNFLVEYDGSAFVAQYATGSGGRPVYTFDPGNPYSGEPKWTRGGDVPEEGGQVREIFVSDPSINPGLGPDVPTLVAQLATSTDHGQNGPRDLGLSFGLELDAGLFNLGAFTHLGIRRRGRLDAPRLWIKDDSPTVLSIIEEQLGAPFGIALAPDESGDLHPASREDSAIGYTMVEFGPDDFIDVPSMRLGWDAVLDQVIFDFDATVDGQTRRVDMEGAIAVKRRLGAAREQSFNAAVIGDDRQAFLAATDILYRHHLPVPPVKWRSLLSKDVPAGRLVKVTSEAILGAAGDGSPSEGVTDAVMLITQKLIETDEGWTEYTAQYIGIDFGRQARISASAKVQSWDGASLLRLKPNAFVPNGGNGVFDADVDAFAPGDQFRHCDDEGAVLFSGIQVDAISGNDLTIGSPPAGWAGSPPVEDDVVIFEVYDSVQTSQQTSDAFVADTAGGLGAAPDVGYEYVDG